MRVLYTEVNHTQFQFKTYITHPLAISQIIYPAINMSALNIDTKTMDSVTKMPAEDERTDISNGELIPYNKIDPVLSIKMNLVNEVWKERASYDSLLTDVNRQSTISDSLLTTGSCSA